MGNWVDGNPTYSVLEALHLMEKMKHDLEGLNMIGEVLTQDKYEYCLDNLTLLTSHWQLLRKDLMKGRLYPPKKK